MAENGWEKNDLFLASSDSIRRALEWNNDEQGVMAKSSISSINYQKYEYFWI